MKFAGIATIIFKPFFQRIGRKGVMVSGGAAFVVGAALQAGALNMGMLIIGRLFLGLGIGFANQVGISTTISVLYLAINSSSRF